MTPTETPAPQTPPATPALPYRVELLAAGGLGAVFRHPYKVRPDGTGTGADVLTEDERAVWAYVKHLEAEHAKLQAFKAYVHQRLDAAGVPADPESPHKAEGCRIGGRLDEVFNERDSLHAQVEDLQNEVAALQGRLDRAIPHPEDAAAEAGAPAPPVAEQPAESKPAKKGKK